MIEIELQNALGDLYWCELSWLRVSSLRYVFICSSVLSLPPFSWVSLTVPVYGCLKVWHSAFYRLGRLTWHTWSLGGKWVCECEMAHVGAWMWLCPAGPACLDLIDLPLVHLHHLIGPEPPVTGLLWGQSTPLPLGIGRWGCGDWLFVQKSWLIYFIFRAIQESR